MPSEVAFGQISSPNDLNQLVDILQRKASQQEAGKYALGGNWAGTGSGFFSTYVPSLSRNATPASVSIDTADQAPTGGAVAPGTDRLSSSGFHVFTSTTNSNNASLAGNYTINY